MMSPSPIIWFGPILAIRRGAPTIMGLPNSPPLTLTSSSKSAARLAVACASVIAAPQIRWATAKRPGSVPRTVATMRSASAVSAVSWVGSGGIRRSSA